ncbi:hypothetical protein I3J09_11015 [Streptomyces clavuligerus]|uniref:Uncharacterized protein n=1 Tax=Streptomyces clavuligerus TaxID=1901 RepID=B5GWE4_STRCL|nr:hypothetical protein BB341_10885 [Streptomyces clavuligerus]AXU13263.1 hypothetical protein D1794_11255 [Streptomyces clavuligerus]EDY50640.1 hypothetical protein SSCG_03842 [Streptomyces clavuligerus]EFG08634.1 Hypothetical protein SCLAV_3562 [Streptomyces clavuligerus]MBY6303213.1 hypothetical protein [Streptomyces clavuligerus]
MPGPAVWNPSTDPDGGPGATGHGPAPPGTTRRRSSTACRTPHVRAPAQHVSSQHSTHGGYTMNTFTFSATLFPVLAVLGGTAVPIGTGDDDGSWDPSLDGAAPAGI